jgi:hypothetical protein
MDPASMMTEGPSTSHLEPVFVAMVEMSVSRQDHQTANQVSPSFVLNHSN